MSREARHRREQTTNLKLVTSTRERRIAFVCSSSALWQPQIQSPTISVNYGFSGNEASGLDSKRATESRRVENWNILSLPLRSLAPDIANRNTDTSHSLKSENLALQRKASRSLFKQREGGGKISLRHKQELNVSRAEKINLLEAEAQLKCNISNRTRKRIKSQQNLCISCVRRSVPNMWALFRSLWLKSLELEEPIEFSL